MELLTGCDEVWVFGEATEGMAAEIALATAQAQQEKPATLEDVRAVMAQKSQDGELRLTIMATLAQNESKKTSMRVKTGQMVSFQNGVIYGTGNVLGYDKVGQEYVINEAQAKTVRKIYDMYLAGNGFQKIKRQLEKDGDLTAMWKTLWHFATIGHILKNRLYCGELEYRKEYVPDYLEQKRVKNNGELERVIVEGRHQPIVTKEEFVQVQKLLEEKSP